MIALGKDYILPKYIVDLIKAANAGPIESVLIIKFVGNYRYFEDQRCPFTAILPIQNCTENNIEFSNLTSIVIVSVCDILLFPDIYSKMLKNSQKHKN